MDRYFMNPITGILIVEHNAKEKVTVTVQITGIDRYGIIHYQAKIIEQSFASAKVKEENGGMEDNMKICEDCGFTCHGNIEYCPDCGSKLIDLDDGGE